MKSFLGVRSKLGNLSYTWKIKVLILRLKTAKTTWLLKIPIVHDLLCTLNCNSKKFYLQAELIMMDTERHDFFRLKNL